MWDENQSLGFVTYESLINVVHTGIQYGVYDIRYIRSGKVCVESGFLYKETSTDVYVCYITNRTHDIKSQRIKKSRIQQMKMHKSTRAFDYDSLAYSASTYFTLKKKLEEEDGFIGLIYNQCDLDNYRDYLPLRNEEFIGFAD